MSEVIGLDGLNRQLHGNGHGWKAGVNVLVLDAGETPQELRDDKGNWRLEILQEIRLDGIVQSNDEPFSSTSNGERDAVIFNNIIQGPTLVNNGYLLYDPEANPSYTVKNKPGTLRTVEAYPRGSIDGGYHVASNTGRPGKVGSQAWLGKGQYDYVAAFTGTYTAYPAQMFDRNVETLNSLYLGLRAYEMEFDTKRNIKDKGGVGDYFKTDDEAKAKRCFFFQVMPFSSRKAWLCQHVQDTIKANLKPGPGNEGYKTAEQTLNEINTRIHGQTRGDKRSRFDEDVFDAVRTEDLANMVGAWHVGRVLDVRAQRQTSYSGGPADSAFAMMVDVQVGWRDAFPVETVRERDVKTSDTDGAKDVRDSYADYTSVETPPASTTDEYKRKERRAEDTHNAEFPSMQKSVGALFGSNLKGYGSKEQTALIAARFPAIDAFWKAIGNPGSISRDALYNQLENKDFDQSLASAIGLGKVPDDLGDDNVYRSRIAKLLDRSNIRTGPMPKQAFFELLGGVRIKSKHDRERWYREGPNAFPTLASLEEMSAEELTMEHMMEATTLAVGQSAFVSLTSTAEAAAPMQTPVEAPVETAVETAAPVETPVEVPMQTPVEVPSTASMAALERSAPVTAAAMARKKAKSPPKTRPTAAAAAPPPGAAGVSSTPLLPSLASSSAGAPAPQSRRRGGAPAPTSTVSSVFDSIFGSGLEQETTTDAPASPTPSSGSEQGSSTGPKTFRKTAPGSRPR
jgi:hypothetical protein